MQKKILIVDDEILILKSLQADLKQAGYETAVAGGGEEALGILAEQPCKLIITDLMMEGLTGIELIEKIRDLKLDIPVIIITAYGELNTAIAAMRLGAADYLLKPFNSEELILRIKNCLEKQELLQKVDLYEKILPVCMFCKKIRDDTGTGHGKGEWKTFEDYLTTQGDLQVSHGLCRDCCAEHYGDLGLCEDDKGG
ncbi:MAG: response regulator [Thermodesulfobacteriota bacterium]